MEDHGAGTLVDALTVVDYCQDQQAKLEHQLSGPPPPPPLSLSPLSLSLPSLSLPSLSIHLSIPWLVFSREVTVFLDNPGLVCYQKRCFSFTLIRPLLGIRVVDKGDIRIPCSTNI